MGDKHMEDMISELIKASPYAGFVIITILSMNLVYKGYRKDLKSTFDVAVEGIKSAYKESSADSRQLIKIFTDKLEKSNKGA